MRKKKLSRNALVGMFLVILISATQGHAEDTVAGSISFMLGDVYISSDGVDFREADFDMAVMNGDHIKTEADSRCEITLTDGTIIRMDENTRQQIEKVVPKPAAQEKSVFVSAGKVWLNARKILSKGDSFKVRTNKAVCAIRGTRFSVDEGAAATRIRVHEGKVATWSSLFEKKETEPAPSPLILQPQPVRGPHAVSIEEWVEIIGTLQQITIDQKGGYEKQDFDMEDISEDPWVAWNLNRDTLVQK